MPSIIAKYYLEAADLEKAASDIAIGQSIGNPDRRTPFDKDLIHHIPHYFVRGNIATLHFPVENFSPTDGVNYLMSVLLGGQMDIGHIRQCRLIELDLSEIEDRFPKPRYGIEGIRKILGVKTRPLVGGIIKPKIGLTPEQLADVVRQMADAGVDFIKEDEILGTQAFCPFEGRLELVLKALEGYKTVYAPCITSDGAGVLRKAKIIEKVGLKACHLNIWCSLGAYKEIRESTRLMIFFQKSGDKIWTTGPYGLEFQVLCQLIHLIGCDFAHVGMKGGYLDEDPEELRLRIKALRNTVPSFSCGATPEILPNLVESFGTDIMITSGGYIGGHPRGIGYAVKEFRKAADICLRETADPRL